ncbi:hypothetical protein QBC39DRAFT_100057 [Podospora conica]|nr:hypothetical protein QBC39DRAFT_100057 [Schizothecium conicum]
MPTFKHPPDSNVTLQPPTWSGRGHTQTLGSPIYPALFVVALVAVLLARFGLSHRPRRAPPGGFQDEKNSFRSGSCKDSAASYTPSDSALHFVWAREPRRHWGILEHGAQPAVGRAGPADEFWAAGKPLAMGETDEEARKEQRTGSTSAASRGVSSNPRHQQNPPPPGVHPGPLPFRYSPPSSTRIPLSRHTGSSDGAEDPWSKGKGPMKTHSDWTRSAEEPDDGPASTTLGGSGASGSWTAQLSNPTLPPPLTTSALSTSLLSFQDRRPSYAVSIPPELDTGFIHRPNPDYFDDSFSSFPGSSEFSELPKGMPIPTTTSSSSNETMTTAETFSPSSYPPTSPLLPPPPPGQEFPYEYQFVGGPGGPGVLLSEHEVQLHDEVISIMDEAGHGWKRHTRVYGGGVCLACAAAGDEGGFYGDSVPMEDRR